MNDARAARTGRVVHVRGTCSSRAQKANQAQPSSSELHRLDDRWMRRAGEARCTGRSRMQPRRTTKSQWGEHADERRVREAAQLFEILYLGFECDGKACRGDQTEPAERGLSE